MSLLSTTKQTNVLRASDERCCKLVYQLFFGGYTDYTRELFGFAADATWRHRLHVRLQTQRNLLVGKPTRTIDVPIPNAFVHGRFAYDGSTRYTDQKFSLDTNTVEVIPRMLVPFPNARFADNDLLLSSPDPCTIKIASRSECKLLATAATEMFGSVQTDHASNVVVLCMADGHYMAYNDQCKNVNSFRLEHTKIYYLVQVDSGELFFLDQNYDLCVVDYLTVKRYALNDKSTWGQVKRRFIQPALRWVDGFGITRRHVVMHIRPPSTKSGDSIKHTIVLLRRSDFKVLDTIRLNSNEDITIEIDQCHDNVLVSAEYNTRRDWCVHQDKFQRWKPDLPFRIQLHGPFAFDSSSGNSVVYDFAPQPQAQATAVNGTHSTASNSDHDSHRPWKRAKLN